jgi:cytochrome c oxidase subunit 2
VVTDNEAFDFVLLCNKICGASHYNMQMPLVVESRTAYDAWYAEAMKKPFQGAPVADAPAAAVAAPDSAMADTTAAITAAATASVQPTH